MKRYILRVAFLLLTYCFSQVLPAQAYHPFPTGHTSLFKVWEGVGDDSAIFATRIDSARLEGADSAFYLFRILRETEYWEVNCDSSPAPYHGLAANRDHHLGKKLLRAANGDCKFIFSTGDTFSINTWAAVGTRFQWRLGDSAKVDSIQYRSVLGVMDSVKYFSIPNGHTIALSRNHGFVKIPTFYFYEAWFWGQPAWRDFDLWGIPTMGLGGHLPTYAEVFQLSPGDKFGYRHSRDQQGHHVMDKTVNCTIVSQTNGARFQYTALCDSLVIEYGFAVPPDSHYFAPGTRTFNFDSLHVPDLTILPHESRFDTIPFYQGTIVQNGAYLINRPVNRVVLSYAFLNGWDVCAQAFTDNPLYLTTKSYGEGLAIKGEGAMSPNNSISYGLYCYQKGAETWGTCMDMSGYVGTMPTLEGKYAVSPNPTAGKLVIAWDQQSAPKTKKTISLWTLEGQEILHQTAGAGFEDVQLDLSEFPNGMYLLRIQAAGYAPSNERIVIAR
jgi:hypothetical protein